MIPIKSVLEISTFFVIRSFCFFFLFHFINMEPYDMGVKISNAIHSAINNLVYSKLFIKLINYVWVTCLCSGLCTFFCDISA